MTTKFASSKLLIDKYRPEKLADYKFIHEWPAKKLMSYIKTKNNESRLYDNLILHGCENSGRSTLARALINQVCGGVSRWNIVNVDEKTQVEVSKGPAHIELLPEQVKFKQLQQIYENISTVSNIQSPFTIIVIHHLDQVPTKYQRGLLKFLERNISAVVMIGIVNSLSCIDPAFKSRCKFVRVPMPDFNNEVYPFINSVINKEEIKINWTVGYAKNFWETKINRNLTRLLLFLDQAKYDKVIFDSVKPDEKSVGTITLLVNELKSPIDKMIKETALSIFTTGNPPARMVLECRGKIIDILNAGCEPRQLLINLYKNISSDPRLNIRQKHEIVKYAAYYEYAIMKGSNLIPHFDAFIAQCLRIKST